MPWISKKSLIQCVDRVEDIKAEFLGLFSLLNGDEHDTVRLLAIEAAIPLAKKLPKDEVATFVVPSLIAAVKVFA